MTETEQQMIERWRSSPEVAADMAIHALAISVDDLTDAAKTREGCRTLRANHRMLWDAKHKLDDLLIDLGQFAMAAE